MKKFFHFICLVMVLSITSFSPAWSQAIRGRVLNSENLEKLTNVSIVVSGSNKGTVTNIDGEFSLVTDKLPVTIVVSMVGYVQVTMTISDSSPVFIALIPQHALGAEVIVSANRTPTRMMESAVSIERFGNSQIHRSPASSYYDIAGWQKGVDITTSSLTFKTISTRGFNASGSPRVNQLVDGMDNQAPALNFFVGSFAGPTDLDIDNVEILPGASSALYGPGGMNGTILITSKDPFQYPGLSVQVRQGLMHVDKRQRDKAAGLYDYSMRWAKSWRNKWGIRLSGQYISGTDWLATDSSNYQGAGATGKLIAGNRQSDPNYNGVNFYGDETSVDLRLFMASVLPPGHPLLQNPMMVSRTGYEERDLIDPTTKNLRLSGAVHYRLTPKLEAIMLANWSKGNTVYSSNNRYALKGINIAQYKIELKHNDWFLRSFTTQENAGEAYSANVTAQYMNEAWKPSFNPADIGGSWYPQYTGAFLTALNSGAGVADAHRAARAYADREMPLPGSEEFGKIFGQVRNTPIPQGGLFKEKSQLWMTEGQYNFSRLVKFADIIVGGNWKRYILNSSGTLFIDTANAITINEFGAYAQVSKDILNKRFNLSASGRYDKNEDFDPKFTPRFTALVRVAKDNNLRLSYQTAYRFPSTQQKYIRLDVGAYTLLGGLPWVQQFMNVKESPVYEMKGSSVSSQPYTFTNLKPENCKSFEVGYKALIRSKLMVDAYAYWAKYENFLGRNVLYQPSSAQVYSVVVNSVNKVNTSGYGIGLQYRPDKRNSFFLNAYSDRLSSVDSGFIAFFNTPKYRLNAGYNNNGIGRSARFGFGVNIHWQDAFFFEGEMASGPIRSFTTLDALVSYKLPGLKGLVKLGANNLTNHYYRNAYGSPEIGGIYYVSLALGVL